MEESPNPEKIVKVNIPGVLHSIALRAKISDEAMYSQIFLQDEYGYVRALRSPKVIVDAGANIGLSSIYFANRYTNAMIIAIEPDAGNFRLLQQNVMPYKNIIPMRAALWSQDGMVSLHDPGLGECAYQTYYNFKAPKDNNIASITINTILAMYGIEYIDILKIDIEGAEVEVFSGACGWISQVGAIIVELHERLKMGCNQAFFGAVKGKFDCEWTGGENFYMARSGYFHPSLPELFKRDDPHRLPIEKLWETQGELSQTKQALDQAQGELSQTKQALDQAHRELGRTRRELGQAHRDLDLITMQLSEIQGRIDWMEEDFGQTQSELGRVMRELGEATGELQVVYNSTSWKVMRPFRKVFDFVRRL